MNYCSNCGAPVQILVPEGEHLPRHVCTQCRTIHYQNPKLVVGCVPDYQGRLLICRRAIEPRRGYWTVPAGFMENGETLQQAAARESQEEALADVEIGSLLTVVHVLHAHQVHVFFRARLHSLDFGVGPESLEVKLIRLDEIPWPELAFPSTEFTLRRYLEDLERNEERHHFTEFDRRPPSR
ncbi:MAG: NUDIX hydrolase [Gammaproteobacteria bacterium]|nr:NUDIX hydrolase [Gammaproteobacteria bacterium]